MLFVNDPKVRAFTKQLERQAYGQGHYSQVFEDFLDFCIYYLSLGLITEPIERLQKTYKEEGMQGFMTLFELLGDGSEDFQDLLGTVYMEIASQYKASSMGQFFTPGSVSNLMAEINLADMDLEREGQKICDPTCGSGIMILKAARKFGDKRHLQFFVGCDLDRICAKMCVVNMAINTIPGQVYWMDSLSLKHYGAYNLVLDRLAGRWITVIYKWPEEHIQKVNERIEQSNIISHEQRKVEMEAERERQREEQVAERLRKKSQKQGFTGTLFD